MSILASLARAYDRLPDAPPFGYSSEKIGFLISLNEDGSVANVTDLRVGEGRKKVARSMLVPQPGKRSSGIAPNFLWDKTAYALGITADVGKRTIEENAEFVRRHLSDLEGVDDAGAKAFRMFLQQWTPETFAEFGWPDEMKDQNVIFALESDRRQGIMLHDRKVMRETWEKRAPKGGVFEAVCLVTGERDSIATLHHSIRNVWGAQSSGASIVSFNKLSFKSYGHDQGDNAPVSELVTFKYTTALNRFLERDSGHRVQVGDASTVFWADASAADAETAEDIFGAIIEGINEKMQASRVGDVLERIRRGEPLASFEPDLARNVRFYVLGLAPNAARLSIRFYFEDTFGALAENYRRFIEDMRIEPPPRQPYPPLWKYLSELAVLGKRENVPPNLGGEWMRAILTGRNYPLTLMSTILTRIRADGDVNAFRVGILKSLLRRNYELKEEASVGLDETNANKGYLLGRLFATYEQIQTAALGSKVNATIKDKFYGSASAQPRKVFSVLESGSANHLSKVGKQKPGYKVVLERQVAGIMALMDPDMDPFPAALSAEQQALFGLGYYHQKFTRKEAEASVSGETAE